MDNSMVKIRRTPEKYRTGKTTKPSYELRRKESTCVYVGVHHHRNGLFQTSLYHKGRTLFLGTYRTDREAAHAFNVAVYVLGRSIHYPNQNLGLSRLQELDVEARLKACLL